MRLVFIFLMVACIQHTGVSQWSVYQFEEKFGAWYGEVGKTHFLPQFQQADIIGEKLLLVKENEKFFIIDNTGNKTGIPDTRDVTSLNYFEQNYLLVKDQNNKITIAAWDPDRKNIASLINDSFDEFTLHENYLVLKKGNLYGAFVFEDSTFIPAEYDSLDIYYGPFFFVKKNNKWSVLHPETLETISSGSYSACDIPGFLISDPLSEEFSFIDYGFKKFRIPPGSVPVEAYPEHIQSMLNGRRILTDRNGNIIKEKFNACERSDKYFIIRFSEETEVLDSIGKILLTIKGSGQLVPAGNDLFAYTENEITSLYFLDGRVLFKGNYVKAVPLISAPEFMQLNRKKGSPDLLHLPTLKIWVSGFSGNVYSFNGEIIVLYQRDRSESDSYHLFNSELQRIYPFAFSNVKIFDDFILGSVNNKKWILLNKKGEKVIAENIDEVFWLMNEMPLIGFKNENGFFIYDTETGIERVDTIASHDNYLMAVRKNGKWDVFTHQETSPLIKAADKVEYYVEDYNYIIVTVTKSGATKKYSVVIDGSGIYEISLHRNHHRFINNIGSVSVVSSQPPRKVFLLWRGSPQPEMPISNIDEGGWMVDSVDVNGNPVYPCRLHYEQWIHEAPFSILCEGRLIADELHDARLMYQYKSGYNYEPSFPSGHYLSLAFPTDIDRIDLWRTDDILPFPVLVKKETGWGMISWKGEKLVPCKYEEIIYMNRNGEIYYVAIHPNGADVFDIHGELKETITGNNFLPLYDSRHRPSAILVNNDGDIKTHKIKSEYLSDPCYDEIIMPELKYIEKGKSGIYFGPGKNFSGAKWDQICYPDYNGKLVSYQDTLEENFLYITDRHSLIVRNKEKWGVFNFDSGKIIVPVQFSSVRLIPVYPDSVLYFCTSPGKSVLYDESGMIVHKGAAENVMIYQDGETAIIALKEGKKITGLKKSGSDYIPAVVMEGIFNYEYRVFPIYDEFGYLIFDENGMQGFYDFNDNEVLHLNRFRVEAVMSYEYYDAYLTLPGPWVVYDTDLAERRYGILDVNGDLLLAPAYEKIILCQENMAAVVKNERVAYYNITGRKFVTGFIYELPETPDPYSVSNLNKGYFNGGIAAVGKGSGLCFINKRGEEIINGPVEEAERISPFLFYLKQNGKYQLVKMNDPPEVIIDDLKSFNSLSGNLYSFSLNNNLSGIIDDSGRIVVRPVYERIFAAGNYFIIQKNNKTGLLDKSFKIILDTKYDSLFLAGNLIVVRENDLFGFMDLHGGVVTPCEYSSVRYDIERGNWVLSIKGNDRELYHIWFSDESRILPFDSDSVPVFIPSLNAYMGYYDNIFFLCTLEGEIINDAQRIWESSFEYKLEQITRPLNHNYEWKETRTPEGAEPTCFFQDAKGVYWMGTGSSGGIFYSKDKGKTWTERNEGIGPWHISRIGEIRDTLFMNAPLEGTYFWSRNENRWVLISNEEHMNYHWEMIDAAEENDSYFVDVLEPVFAEIENIPPYQFRLQRFMWNSYDYHSHSHQFYETTDNLLIGFRNYGDENLKIDFSDHPIPLNSLESSAFHLLRDSSIIIIGRNALYLLKNKKVSQLGLMGLTATDVRQIISTENGNYALVGCCEIWGEKNGSWKRVFSPSFKDTAYYNTDEPSPGRIDRLWETEYGLFQFGCGGKIYNMDKSEKLTLVAEEKILTVNNGENKTNALFYPVQEMTYSMENRYMLGISALDDMLGFYYSNGNSVNLIAELPDNTFLYYSVNGRIMICNNKGITDFEKYDPNAPSQIRDYMDPSLLTEDENGNIYFYGATYDLLYHYNLRSDKIISVSVNTPENFSPSVLYYDPQLGIFCGTGHEYNFSCGDRANEKASGLYRLEKSGSEYTWKKIEGDPNPSVFSILKEDKGFLIGTSGSGFVRLEIR